MINKIISIVLHFEPTVLKKLSSKKKKISNKWLAKLKDIVKILLII